MGYELRAVRGGAKARKELLAGASSAVGCGIGLGERQLKYIM
jgi:hypothetical protein